MSLIEEQPAAIPHVTLPAPPIRILVCVGPRCDAEGRGRALLAEVRAALARTYPEELAGARLQLATRDCLRLCTLDPVLRLEPSGDAVAGPDVDDLMETIRNALSPVGRPDGA